MSGKTWGRLWAGTRNHKKLVALSRKHPTLWLIFYPLLEMSFEADDDGKVYVTPEVPYTLGDLADEVRVPVKKLLPALETMAEVGLIFFEPIFPEKFQNFCKKTEIFLQFPGYTRRQFKSDNVTERTRRFKEKQGVISLEERSPKRSRNVPGNGPEAEAEAEAETEKRTPKVGGVV